MGAFRQFLGVEVEVGLPDYLLRTCGTQLFDVRGVAEDVATLGILNVNAIRKGIYLYFFIVYNLNDIVRDAAIQDLSMLLAGNQLNHNIAARLPLAQIAEAHDLVENGRVNGNVVLGVE